MNLQNGDRSRYRADSRTKGTYEGLITAMLTAALLLAARTKGPDGILFLDRIYHGSGLVQVLLLSAYGGFIAFRFRTSADSSVIRLRIWSLFSIVFFSQLILGIAVSDIFLMTGKLHIPVPAVIIAGPLYRGSGFFMPVLFISTLLITGPAWCSHLCYFGVWDGIAASGSRPRKIRKKKLLQMIKFTILPSAAASAILLRLTGVSPGTAAVAAIGFGLCGAGIMIFVSRNTGSAVHCTYFCPAGTAAVLIGRLSPFRIKIDETCTECGVCTSVCRYNALSPKDISRKKPGITCTLCGDCISSCSRKSIHYSFLNLSPEVAGSVFRIAISALHASFLGIARI